MTDDADTAERADWTEQIVATSEPESPIETVGRLFDIEAGPEQLTEAFLDQGVTIEASDYFLDEDTRHEVHLEDAVEHVPCVADALQVAVLVDQEPVTVRSIDPVTETPVTFEVGADSLDVDPATHVVSIGVNEELVEALPEGTDVISFTATVLGNRDLEPALESRAAICEGPMDADLAEVRALGCAYINAFESQATYQEWARDVDGVTVAVKAGAIMPGTRAFVASPVFD